MTNLVAAILTAALFKKCDGKKGTDPQVFAFDCSDELIAYLIRNGINPVCLAIRLGLNSPEAMNWAFLKIQFAACVLYLCQRGLNIEQGATHEE